MKRGPVAPPQVEQKLTRTQRIGTDRGDPGTLATGPIDAGRPMAISLRDGDLRPRTARL
jgi:hypothetical protein